MFKSLGRGIVFIVDGIAKCCAVLLVSFGLWIPCLYSGVFLFVSLSATLEFGGAVQVVFFIGLGVSIMAGLVFASFLAKRKRAKRQVVPVKNNNNNKNSERQDQNYPKTRVLPKQEIFVEHEEYAAPKPRSAKNTSAYDKKYIGQIEDDEEIFDEPIKEKVIREEPKRYRQDLPPNKTIDTVKPVEQTQTYKEQLPIQSRQRELPHERPMIFATRSDPNLYVYEYSDRLQFWRKKGKELTLVGTDFKDKVPDNNSRK